MIMVNPQRSHDLAVPEEVSAEAFSDDLDMQMEVNEVRERYAVCVGVAVAFDERPLFMGKVWFNMVNNG